MSSSRCRRRGRGREQVVVVERVVVVEQLVDQSRRPWTKASRPVLVLQVSHPTGRHVRQRVDTRGSSSPAANPREPMTVVVDSGGSLGPPVKFLGPLSGSRVRCGVLECAHELSRVLQRVISCTPVSRRVQLWVLVAGSESSWTSASRRVVVSAVELSWPPPRSHVRR